MNSEKIYLDTNIFVAYMHKKHKNHNEVLRCLSVMEKLDLDVFYSHWTIIEGERVLIKEYGYSPEKAKQKFLSLIKKAKIKKIPLKLIGIKNTCGSNDLLYLIRQLRLSADISLADSIHSLIMSDNEINTILTTDEHFSVLKEVIVLFPKHVLIMKAKKKITN